MSVSKKVSYKAPHETLTSFHRFSQETKGRVSSVVKNQLQEMDIRRVNKLAGGDEVEINITITEVRGESERTFKTSTSMSLTAEHAAILAGIIQPQDEILDALQAVEQQLDYGQTDAAHEMAVNALIKFGRIV